MLQLWRRSISFSGSNPQTNEKTKTTTHKASGALAIAAPDATSISAADEPLPKPVADRDAVVASDSNTDRDTRAICIARSNACSDAIANILADTRPDSVGRPDVGPVADADALADARS